MNNWKPSYDEYYLYIDNIGHLHYSNWYGFLIDTYRFEIGNVFRTKEEAEFQIEKLKVTSELKSFSKKFEENKDNFCIKYEMINQYIEIYNNYYYATGELCFSSEKDARDAIEFVGEERILKYYLGIEGI